MEQEGADSQTHTVLSLQTRGAKAMTAANRALRGNNRLGLKFFIDFDLIISGLRVNFSG